MAKYETHIVAKSHTDVVPPNWYVIGVIGDSGQVLSVHSDENQAWRELETIQLKEENE